MGTLAKVLTKPPSPIVPRPILGPAAYTVRAGTNLANLESFINELPADAALTRLFIFERGTYAFGAGDQSLTISGTKTVAFVPEDYIRNSVTLNCDILVDGAAASLIMSRIKVVGGGLALESTGSADCKLTDCTFERGSNGTVLQTSGGQIEFSGHSLVSSAPASGDPTIAIRGGTVNVNGFLEVQGAAAADTIYIAPRDAEYPACTLYVPGSVRVTSRLTIATETIAGSTTVFINQLIGFNVQSDTTAGTDEGSFVTLVNKPTAQISIVSFNVLRETPATAMPLILGCESTRTNEDSSALANGQCLLGSVVASGVGPGGAIPAAYAMSTAGTGTKTSNITSNIYGPRCFRF